VGWGGGGWGEGQVDVVIANTCMDMKNTSCKLYFVDNSIHYLTPCTVFRVKILAILTPKYRYITAHVVSSQIQLRLS